MLGPAFFVSPGLLQKVYGARDGRAVRWGVLANALVLFAFAFMPPLLGMMSRALHPQLANREMALPVLLMENLPPWVGSLGLAALFSAEVSTADAILFMLATSLSQDLYKRFVRPEATDRQVLTVARLAAIAGGLLGIGIAMLAPTVSDALSFFYTLLSVSLFVPIVAGLYAGRTGAPEILSAIFGGVAIAAASQLGLAGRLPAGITPAMLGLTASLAAWALLYSVRRRTPV
jgi:SSS family solute:Na+ symporter